MSSRPFMLRPAGLGLLVLMLTLSADQLSKYWILYGLDLPARGSVKVLPFLNFTMVWNHAVTFGMFGGLGGAGRIVFSAIALAVACCLLVWIFARPANLPLRVLGPLQVGPLATLWTVCAMGPWWIFCMPMLLGGHGMYSTWQIPL